MSEERLNLFGDHILASYWETLEQFDKYCKEDPFLANLCAPLDIAWNVTYKCNFQCLHCFNLSGPKWRPENKLPDPLFVVERIIESNPFCVCLCGGEPLLWKPVFEVTRRLSEVGIQVNMVTNGWLFDKKCAIKLKKCGMKLIQVSLDGATPQTHDRLRNRRGSFKRAISAIMNALECEFETISVAFIPTKFNVAEFSDFVDLVVNLGVKLIRLQPLMPMGRGAQNASAIVPTGAQYLKLVWELRQKQIEKKANALFEWGDPVEHIYIYSQTKKVPHILSIRPDGAVELSPYLPIEVGNIKDNPITEIWQGGIKRMWLDPKVQDISRQLLTLEGMKYISPTPYREPSLYIDIFKEMLSRPKEEAIS